MPDRVLLKFLVPILLAVVGFLGAWTAIAPSHAITIVASNELKYVSCSWDIWNYTAFAGEAAFLLWGVYLSFMVRKAPSHFNESKYITWSIYNATILGSFMIVITQFVAVPIGPDVVYATQFAQMLVRVIIPLCLIFLPKFYSLYKKKGDMSTNENITGRMPTVTTSTLAGSISTGAGSDVCHVGVQANICCTSNHLLPPTTKVIARNSRNNQVSPA